MKRIGIRKKSARKMYRKGKRVRAKNRLLLMRGGRRL